MTMISGLSGDETSAVPLQPEGNTAGQRALLLTSKELRETLRDRRTIITLLAMPLLLYPLLGMVFRFMAVSQLKRDAAPDFAIAAGTEVEALWLRHALELGEKSLDGNASKGNASKGNARKGNASKGSEGSGSKGSGSEGSGSKGSGSKGSGSEGEPATPELSEPRVNIVSPRDPASFDLHQAVASQQADLGVEVRLVDWNGRLRGLQAATVRLISCRDSATSREALRFVEQRLQAANMQSLMEFARSVDSTVRAPIQTSRSSVASTQKSRGFLGLLPLVLLLMTVTGGVYPAIDLTAGERERDTLETLIALPIPRVHLLLAKYVAVFTVTMLTGIMNILAMAATVYTLRMELQLFGDDGLTLRLALALVGILVVFGLFYSAVLLALTSSSRSFKEAQAYLIPLMLLSLTPGLVILLPGWQLEGLISVAPLVNMLLLARDVFEGTARLFPATAAVASTLIYAGIALAVAAQIFGTDAVAVGSRGTWSELWRRPALRSEQPLLATGLMILGMLFPLYFFANGLLSRISDEHPQNRVLASGGLTILLFGALPAAVAYWRRLQPSTTWQFRRPALQVWPAALLLGCGAWPCVYELVMLTQQIGFARLDPARLQQVAEILERWRMIPLPVMVLCFGILPGMFEELFFRGFLLSSLRSSFRPAAAILLCGAIFGVFHVIATEGAALERLLPSTCLGCLLAWVAVRTGSVWPGMLVHVCHNSSLLVIAHYRDELQGLLGAEQLAEHLPASWLAASVVSVVISVLWIRVTPKTAASAGAPPLLQSEIP